MGYIQQNFKKNNNLKIVLSEGIYTRLAGCINLCGFDMGFEKREFGTILYGNIVDDKTINFEASSERNDYQQKSCGFSLSDNMWEELVEKTSGGQFNCIAHVHTHPNLEQEYNRFLSAEDVNFYRKLSSSLGNGFHTLGCMLSVSGENSSNSDDISFVYCNPQTGEIFNVPNIYVRINENQIPLKKVLGTYEANGTTYTFERTLFELGENLEKNSGIRR